MYIYIYSFKIVEIPADLKHEMFEVEEAFLIPKPENEEEYIRKRG